MRVEPVGKRVVRRLQWYSEMRRVCSYSLYWGLSNEILQTEICTEESTARGFSEESLVRVSK